MIHHILKFLIQFIQLCYISFCIFFIIRCIFRINLTEFFFDLLNDLHCIHRRSPHMFINLMYRMRVFLSMLFMICFVLFMLRIILVMIVMIVMIMTTFFFHSFHMFLFHCIDTVYQLQSLSSIVRHGFKNVFYPGIILTTHIDKQITVLDRNNILWCRLIRMCLLTRF